MSFHNEQEDETDKDTGMLLNLSQKSGIFVADQTPTPTRLIKNCEEVGLFEDLQNVNPFDETFRRACEQNAQHSDVNNQPFHIDENSLHTPQVFPQFDTAVEGGIVADEDLTKQTLNTPVVLDVESVENILDVSQTCSKTKSAAQPCVTKYRAIAEKPAVNNMQTSQIGLSILPSCIQFIQPQVITVTFPSPTTQNINNTASQLQHHQTIQTKKSAKNPFLLPKLSTSNTTSNKDAAATTTTNSGCFSTTNTHLTPHPEPSSASLTPTSQLPIKERLKAILNQSSRARPADWSDKSFSTRNFKSRNNGSAKDDIVERKRAASTRYRHKIRNEYKELRKRNTELQIENVKLKEKIKQLEIENSKLKSSSLQPELASSTLPDQGVPSQIQIPASAIHLVMNIPKLVIPYGISEIT